MLVGFAVVVLVLCGGCAVTVTVGPGTVAVTVAVTVAIDVTVRVAVAVTVWVAVVWGRRAACPPLVAPASWNGTITPSATSAVNAAATRA